MVMPFTVVCSWFILHKRYTLMQLLGVVIVLVGMAFSLVPLFVSMASGKASAEVDNWFHPLLFALGMLPAALMNIGTVTSPFSSLLSKSNRETVQEKLQIKWRDDTGTRLSIFAFQAIESAYQSLSFILLAWVNLIPEFGSATSVAGALSDFGDSWTCFFAPNLISYDRCMYAGAFGLAFILCYILSYVANTAMTEYTSANLSALVTTSPAMIATVFWFAWPAANNWAGGAAPSSLDVGFNIGALPFVAAGAILYRLFESEKQYKHSSAHAGTELC
jgi:hypothetical protein